MVQKSGFKFSKNKSVAMLFTRKKKNICMPNLVFNNMKLKYVDQHKFLGQIFDPKLSWVPHINATKAKASKALNVLRMLHCRYGADRKILLRLHETVVLPIIEYEHTDNSYTKQPIKISFQL